jgi:hypothetical protein
MTARGREAALQPEARIPLRKCGLIDVNAAERQLRTPLFRSRLPQVDGEQHESDDERRSRTLLQNLSAYWLMPGTISR